MDVMFETKSDDGKVCFLTGHIAYNGDFSSIENAGGGRSGVSSRAVYSSDGCSGIISPAAAAASVSTSFNSSGGNSGSSGAAVHTMAATTTTTMMTAARGSFMLVCYNLRAVHVKLDTCNRRKSTSNPEIIEIDLLSMGRDGLIDFSTKAAVEAFFQKCSSKVDVILDPYHSSHQWYPYFEGTRKMAPQFRSKGIGYLRLGDDMSQFGSAFISLDAGKVRYGTVRYFTSLP